MNFNPALIKKLANELINIDSALELNRYRIKLPVAYIEMIIPDDRYILIDWKHKYLTVEKEIYYAWEYVFNKIDEKQKTLGNDRSPIRSTSSSCK